MIDFFSKKFKKLHNIIPGLLIVFGIIVVLQAFSPLLLQHEILIKGGIYNAGKVKSGYVIHNSIQFTNLSPFVIKMGAQPGCGCTLLDLSSDTIKPFHREVLSYAVNTAAVHPGKIHKPIYLIFRTGSTEWERVAYIDAFIEE